MPSVIYLWFICACYMTLRWHFLAFLDSADGIASELVGAGLVDGRDIVVGKNFQQSNFSIFYSSFLDEFQLCSLLSSSVAANLQKIMDKPPESKGVTFALVSMPLVFPY